jgi:hypothetical protein
LVDLARDRASPFKPIKLYRGWRYLVYAKTLLFVKMQKIITKLSKIWPFKIELLSICAEDPTENLLVLDNTFARNFLPGQMRRFQSVVLDFSVDSGLDSNSIERSVLLIDPLVVPELWHDSC